MTQKRIENMTLTEVEEILAADPDPDRSPRKKEAGRVPFPVPSDRRIRLGFV